MAAALSAIGSSADTSQNDENAYVSRSPELVLGGRYLTIGDLRSPVPRLSRAIKLLSTVPAERSLDWAARMVAPSFRGSSAARAHEISVARAQFTRGPSDRRALDLVLSSERQLFAPHILLYLGRLAVVYGSDRRGGDHEDPRDVARYERILLEAMLIAAHYAGSRNRSGKPLGAGGATDELATVTAMDLELAANIMANRKPFAPSSFHRSERRWIELPAEDANPGAVDLAAEFEDATGVRLADLRMVGSVLWARTAAGGRPHISKDHLSDLGMGHARTAAVMGLVSADLPTLKSEAQGAGLSEYESSLFSRFPLVKCYDASYIIMNEALLVERTLGWLPRYDLDGLTRKGVPNGKRRAAAAITYLRTTTERQSVETVQALVDAEQYPGKLYGETDIQRAYGTTLPNADIAVVWAADIAVLEISSRTIMRGTAAGSSADDFAKDLNHGVIAKANQIDSTINNMRRDLAALAGPQPKGGRRRIWPILVTTEGWPVTPRMTRRVQQMLVAKGLLQQEDVESLNIVDLEALEAAESVIQRTGQTMVSLLEQHRASRLSNHGFRDWLLDAYAPVRPTARIMTAWDRVLSPALEALETAEERRAAGIAPST